MTTARKATTTTERNKLFRVLEGISRGQSVALHSGHKLETAAREFDAEVSGAAGIVLCLTRAF